MYDLICELEKERLDSSSDISTTIHMTHAEQIALLRNMLFREKFAVWLSFHCAGNSGRDAGTTERFRPIRRTREEVLEKTVTGYPPYIYNPFAVVLAKERQKIFNLSFNYITPTVLCGIIVAARCYDEL